MENEELIKGLKNIQLYCDVEDAKYLEAAIEKIKELERGYDHIRTCVGQLKEMNALMGRVLERTKETENGSQEQEI